MREQIADLIRDRSGDLAYGYSNLHYGDLRRGTLLPLADQILALFRAEVEKLKPLSDEEIEKELAIHFDWYADVEAKFFRELTQVQLASDKKELLEKLRLE